MHMHAVKIRVMLRLCGSSYVLFTIFAASTIVVVSARNCNGNNKYVDTNNDPLRSGNMPQKPKPTNQKGRPNPSITSKDPSAVPSNGTKVRNRCCPYDFDSSLCKIVDDRILCGYNRNAGRPKNKDTVVDLHGGCRLRAGRLECGYQHPPFTAIRRPPPWNNPHPNIEVGKPRPKP